MQEPSTDKKLLAASNPLCVFFQGDVMFRNWRSIFNGDGGPMDARIPIYSFDGRDVLADPFWLVNLIHILLVCVCLLLCSVILIFSVIFSSGLRRTSGTAPPAEVTDWWTNTVRRGERTTCLSWASPRAWPQVCSWASRRGAVPISTSFFASRPTKTIKSPLPTPIPLHHASHRKTLGEKISVSFLEKDVVFSTSSVLRVAFSVF